jgi:hypothetical protein
MTTQQSAQIDCNPTHIRFSLRRWRNRVAVDNEPFTFSQGSRFAANPGLKVITALRFESGGNSI